MKCCPKCSRDYYDDSLSYCLDDGTELLHGPSAAEQPTAVFPASSVSAEHDLTRVFENSTADGAVRINSIAVLPFKNISADAENEYFCEGLAERL